MAGAPVKHARMNVGARAACEALKEVAHQFRLQIADPRRSNLSLDHGYRAAAKVHCRQSESLVHGHQKIPGSPDAAPVAKSAVERLTQRDPHIFHRVVLIHIQIAPSREFQVEPAVPREQFEHMVEKTDPGGDFVLSAALNGEGNLNFRFCGLAMQFSFPHDCTSFVNGLRNPVLNPI